MSGPPPPFCPEGTLSIAFVGPSLPPERARALAPLGCVIAPPVRFGDLYALIGAGVETVLILDGVFHGDTPVWQREILAALDAGLCVAGAASMGALRALELAPYGMLGLGTVVTWYRDGRIEGDDEVALLHADVEMGYLALSLPLVDIRFALEAAVSKGGLPAEGVAALLARLKRTCHEGRTLRRAMAEAAALGLDVEAVGAALGPGRESLKAADAEQALRALAEPARLAERAEVGVEACWPRRAMLPRAEATLLRGAYTSGGAGVRLRDVLVRSTAEVDETARRLREASRRWFLVDWCALTGRGPSAEEVTAHAEAVLARGGGEADVSPEKWLRASGLTRADLPELSRGEAVERWLLRTGAAAAGLPEPGAHPSPIPLALLEWAQLCGVEPPAELRDVDSRAAWIVQSGPGAFGMPEWNADVAVARALQFEGRVTAEALAAEQTGGLLDAE
jgi:hypothetical protein